MSEQDEMAEAEVEGFGSINTTRSNIKNSAGHSAVLSLGLSSSAISSALAATQGYAVKENGVK